MPEEIQDVIEQVMAEAKAVAGQFKETQLFPWSASEPAQPEPVEVQPEQEGERFETPELDTPESQPQPVENMEVASESSPMLLESSEEAPQPSVVDPARQDFESAPVVDREQAEFPVQPSFVPQSFETVPEAETPASDTQVAPEAAQPVREESAPPETQALRPDGRVEEPRSSEFTTQVVKFEDVGEFFSELEDAPQSGGFAREDAGPPETSSTFNVEQEPELESATFSWDTTAGDEADPFQVEAIERDPEPDFSSMITKQSDAISNRLSEEIQHGFAQMYGKVADDVQEQVREAMLMMDRRHVR